MAYRCPRTGMNVQGWADVDEPSADDDTYEPMACLACRQIHRQSGHGEIAFGRRGMSRVAETRSQTCKP